MPTLEWIGKEKVVNHHLEVPYRVLERKYSFDENGQTEADNCSENKIIHGNNLEALKSLLPQYEGKVKCIYICRLMCLLYHLKKAFQEMLQTSVTGAVVQLSLICKVV